MFLSDCGIIVYMRVGINASFARKPNTGIGQVTLNFLKKLSEFKMVGTGRDLSVQNGIEYFLYLEEELPKKIKLPKNFKTRVVLPIWKRDDLIRAMWRDKWTLPRIIKKDKCDVFISLYQSALVLPKNIKHIMIVHDVILELFSQYLDNSRKRKFWDLTKKAIKKVDKIIAVSHRTKKDLVRHLGIDPHKITVNYIDVDEIYKKPVETRHASSLLKKYKLKPGYIYSGGGLEVRKNIEGVIRAYNLLLKRNKTLHFVENFPDIVISGKLMPDLAPLITDAEKLVKELNLTQHIKLLDFVPQEDLPALYKNASVFVYPSFYEGFGLPILEAMNQGVPVIAGKTSSLPEVGRDAVLYCDPNDVEDIAMVMKNLLINKHLRDKLKERGKDRAKYFSWNKFVEKALNIINERNF